MALGSVASFRMYVVLSVLLSTAVVSHAAFQKRFFYRTMVYLSDSKVAIMAAGNLALVSVILVWKLVQAIFLGRLRFREIERLNVRARDAIIECCFATTIFRDEVNLSFLALVTTLLMVKSLHWLAKDRMDFLEEQPLSPRVAHVRLLGLMGLLFAMDVYMVAECAKVTYRLKVGTMLVLFAFEFTVLLIELCSDFVRYVFHAIDLRMDGRWESKGMYVFYNELVTDLCQLTVYLAFFLYVHIYYTFPLHILREVYLTFSKFQRRCSDFIRYRRVMSTMNDRFPDATEEELAAGDRTCIICREEMPTAKKLPCGHMFHAHCLQSWLRRQLSCPTCRSPVDVATPVTSRGGDANGPVEGPAIANGAGENGAPQAEHAPENPGLMANAQRLWRHIAYGAPREGAPPPAANAPAPAQAEPPQAPAAGAPEGAAGMNINDRIAAARALLPAGLLNGVAHQARPVPVAGQPAPQPPPLPRQSATPGLIFPPTRPAPPLERLPGGLQGLVPVPQPGGDVVYMRFPSMEPPGGGGRPQGHVHVVTGGAHVFPGVSPPNHPPNTVQALVEMQGEIDRIHAQVGALRARMADVVQEAAVAEAVRASGEDAGVGEGASVPAPSVGASAAGASSSTTTQAGASLPVTASHSVAPSISSEDAATMASAIALSREQEEVRQRRLRFLDGGRNGRSGPGASNGNTNESG